MNDVARNWVEGETGKMLPPSLPLRPRSEGSSIVKFLPLQGSPTSLQGRSLKGRPAILRPSGRKSS